MWLILLLVVAIVILIYWNPSPRLQKNWKKRQEKWEQKINKLQKERGMSDIWKNEETEKKQ